MRLYVLYLIWNYSTKTSLTLLLMRKNLTGAWSKVGASKNLSVLSQNKPKLHDWTQHATQFVLKIFVNWMNWLWNSSERSSQPFKHRQCRQISFFKNLFILDILNVLGLKNSTDFKKNMEFYTNLPIFEDLGC